VADDSVDFSYDGLTGPWLEKFTSSTPRISNFSLTPCRVCVIFFHTFKPKLKKGEKKIKKGDFENGVVLPLIAFFESASQADSSYLGRGWAIPLLESRAVPSGNDSYTVLMPNGEIYEFRRSLTHPNLFYDRRGWRGEAKNDEFTAWSWCGEWKARWRNGRIQEISNAKGRRFQYRWSGDRVSEIAEVGYPAAFSVETDPIKGVTGFRVNNRLLSIHRDKKPEVEDVAGTLLVRDLSESLSRIEWEEKPPKSGLCRPVSGFADERRYKFEVDEKTLFPNLTITSAGVNEAIRYEWDADVLIKTRLDLK
jgi:hypothetical protein